MLMRAFLNHTVKMFGNWKQTGHQGETMWKVQLGIRVTQEYIPTSGWDF